MAGNLRAFIALFLLLAFPALALEGLEKRRKRQVAKVVDGDTVVLKHAIDGALQVRLVGIQAPKLPLGGQDSTPGPWLKRPSGGWWRWSPGSG